MVHLSFGIISSHIQWKYIVSISSVWNFVLFCNVDCNSIIFFQTYVLIIHFIKINVFYFIIIPFFLIIINIIIIANRTQRAIYLVRSTVSPCRFIHSFI